MAFAANLFVIPALAGPPWAVVMAAAACTDVVALVDHVGLGVMASVGLPSFVVGLAAACGAADAVLVHLPCAGHTLPPLFVVTALVASTALVAIAAVLAVAFAAQVPLLWWLALLAGSPALVAKVWCSVLCLLCTSLICQSCLSASSHKAQKP